jgi:hypothetical protein
MRCSGQEFDRTPTRRFEIRYRAWGSPRPSSSSRGQLAPCRTRTWPPSRTTFRGPRGASLPPPRPGPSAASRSIASPLPPRPSKSRLGAMPARWSWCARSRTSTRPRTYTRDFHLVLGLRKRLSDLATELDEAPSVQPFEPIFTCLKCMTRGKFHCGQRKRRSFCPQSRQLLDWTEGRHGVCGHAR